MAEPIIGKRKEVKLKINQTEFLVWLSNTINDKQKETSILIRHYNEYIAEILRMNKEIPTDKWDVDLMRGILVEKGVPTIGSNSNNNKPQ